MASRGSRPPTRRVFALLLAVLQLLLGCPPANPPLAPRAGWVERRAVNLVVVPGGFVDVAGGSFLVHRQDLVLDTRLGRETLGAVYDSVRGSWRWSFESSYDGATFVDESGASFTVGALAPGAAIPGTHWVKLDTTRIKTKGGLVHEYAAGGMLAARYWASDPYPRVRQRTTSIAGAPRVTTIEQCTSASACSALFALSYDAAGRLVSVVDRAGRRAVFAWDAAGRLVTARDGLDVAKGWPGFRYTYAGTLLASVTNSEGERTLYTYAGRALASATQQGPGSPVHRFQYEGQDTSDVYHTRFWNPLGEESRFAYDAQGRLLERLEVALGEATRFAWSGERMTRRTLPNGATTQWVISGDDVSARSEPSGNVVHFDYRPLGVSREDPNARPIASIRDSLGSVETRSYDSAGRLIEIVNGAGEATRFTWVQGALTSETSRGVTRSFSEIGEHGHPERITALGGTEIRLYDAVGNNVRGSDGGSPVAGGIELRAFDEDRNLEQLTLHPLGTGSGPATITLEHRSDGRKKRVLRGGDDHELVYDAFGFLFVQRERVDGFWRTTRFGHDAAGRPVFVERPNGMREEIAWGTGNRIASVRRLQGGVLESTLAFSYSQAELVRVDDSETGAETYVYDGAGRRISTRFAGGERLDAQYDLRSRVGVESFRSAQGGVLATLSYGHDLADRRVSIADTSGELWAASFSAGQLAELRYGNGLRRSFSYRDDGLIDGATTRAAGGALVEESTLAFELEFDGGAPRLAQRATTTTHGGLEVTTVEEYVLGPVPDGTPGSAAGARVVAWSDGSSASEAYAFDARSNLRALGDTSFRYNAEGNRLLSVVRGGQTIGSYAYDTAGFASSRNGIPLVWNAAGRLVAHGADTLVWDGLGRLREARVGGVAARFAFGGRVQASAGGTPLAIDLGEVVVGLAGVHRYRHLDFRGNVKWLSDDAGRVVAHYRYAPFGLDAVFGSDDDPVRFAGRAEIGELMLLGARVYDPAVGRFLSPDPLFQIVNQYAYTLGNPVWFADPDGLSEAANDSASGVVEGIALAGAAIGVVGRILAFAPTPQTVVIGNGLSLLGAILVALAAAIRLTGKGAISGPAIPGMGGGGSGSGGSIGSGGSGCAPAGTAALPRLRSWLGVLVPLQLLLGFLVLRRRREERA